MTGMTTRDLATDTAKAWEKRAHAERFIETKLHPRAMGWLIDEIEKALSQVGGASAPTMSIDSAKPKGKATAKA